MQKCRAACKKAGRGDLTEFSIRASQFGRWPNRGFLNLEIQKPRWPGVDRVHGPLEGR
jgi:hypothetical protein